jgi:arsenate reductase (thioredoxin)
MKRVLILCTGNSCRSQMAEGLWNHLAGGTWRADSAGSKPAGYVHPLAIRVMGELGLDIARNRSKSLSEFQQTPFDLVITVCDNAQEACPTFPGSGRVLHWPFEDPYHAPGNDEEKLVEFRRVRDLIRDKIAAFLRE